MRHKGILLPGLDIRCTAEQQAQKVNEEIQEFHLEQARQPDLRRVAEEAFDVMQALLGYLALLGVDIDEANRLHLYKMQRRYPDGQVR